MCSLLFFQESESMMRKRIKLGLAVCATWFLLSAIQTVKADAPLAQKYLLEGKLTEGTKALDERLKVEPKDDQARFGLGVIQFIQTFEHVGGSFYKFGLRTEKAFLRPVPEIREFLPQNPNPETLTYAASRQMVQTFVDDLAKVEATLAQINDPNVKLPLPVGLIKMDPFGQGKPISAAFLFGRIDGPGSEMSKMSEKVIVGFDRGDVCWLRGYCHLLAAIGELLLAVDGQKAFDCTAHLLFEKVETPHTFLLESRRAFDLDLLENLPAISDVISFFHQIIRLTVKVLTISIPIIVLLMVRARSHNRLQNQLLADAAADGRCCRSAGGEGEGAREAEWLTTRGGTGAGAPAPGQRTTSAAEP
jgi:hypothetical protein